MLNEQAFVEFKREILKGAENSRTSKPIAPKLISTFEKAEADKDEEIERVRLSNINRQVPADDDATQIVIACELLARTCVGERHDN